MLIDGPLPGWGREGTGRAGRGREEGAMGGEGQERIASAI
jgi:hypothetical protein